MARYGTIQGIPKSCFGVRNWLKYEEPRPFNIIVNDMSDVLKHKDAALPKSCNYGIQSSTMDWCYTTGTTGKRKRL